MNNKYFFGIILILIGAGFLLDQFAIISIGHMLSLYWPSLLILFGVFNFLDRKSSKFGNLAIIVFGGLLQLSKLELIDVNVYQLFWPIILILLGLNIIFSKKKPSIIVKTNINLDKNNNTITLEDTIDSFVMLGGISTNNQSRSFKGGKATAIMGGIELDLRGAELYNNEATIEINAIMGGMEIYVPESWKVEISGLPILGGWSNKSNKNLDKDAPLLKIKCTAVMGGIDIK